MGYTNLSSCLTDLERTGRLKRIEIEIDAHLEMGVIQRRVYQAGGPALLFTRVKNCRFPMVGNLFGSLDRVKYIFRDSLKALHSLVAIKVDPMTAMKHPFKHVRALPTLVNSLPKNVSTGPILRGQTDISALPQLVSWPKDGGPYITLPQVYSEDPNRPGFSGSNLGMYRIQLSGNAFAPNKEIGLHYQIHRGIGSHHAAALEKNVPFPVNIFVGGSPAMTLAAIMPLPEGMPEIHFAGMLAGRRIAMITRPGSLPIPAEADFCITGTIIPGKNLPEGPFGDHLGYYSLTHDFPVLAVDKVYHRPNAVWPFTTVGRPPQEDTAFGAFIHELVGPLVPTVFHAVHQVHAVDAAGVHPLLLAVGSERYVPFAEKRQPQELLTCAMSLLGTTQTSLSKFVLIAAKEDEPNLNAHDIPAFFRHMLERADFTRDLHFITRTTMDTLDYSGISLNQGSKLVLAAAGPKKWELSRDLPGALRLPDGFKHPTVFAPGILLVEGPKHDLPRDMEDPVLTKLADHLAGQSLPEGLRIIVVTDDAVFTAATWNNFLWVTFTRADPATDINGVGAFVHCKHWGCSGPIIIDARLKKHHPEPLEADPNIEKRVNELAAPGQPLHGIF